MLQFYGRDLPATGFALRLKMVLIALERQKGLPKMPRSEYLIGFDRGARKAAFERMRALRSQGYIVEQFLGDGVDEFKRRMQQGGARKAEYFQSGAGVLNLVREARE